jgi:hypothetical protein
MTATPTSKSKGITLGARSRDNLTMLAYVLSGALVGGTAAYCLSGNYEDIISIGSASAGLGYMAKFWVEI